MKNQYFGDVRDLFKYDLIQSIIKETDSINRILYIPMLTKNDERKDGNKIDYNKAKAGTHNEDLVKFLCNCVKSDRRNITELKFYFQLKGIEIDIYNESFFQRNRKSYFSGIKELFSSSLIFVDPDKGLEIKRSNEMHLLYDEAQFIYNRMDKNSILMIYQHFPRKDHIKYLCGRAKELKKRMGDLPIYISDNEIIFFFLTKNHELKNQLERIMNMYKREYSALQMGTVCQVDATGIGIAASYGLTWLKEQEPQTIKDISRSIQALSLWNEPTSFLIEKLMSMRKDGYWETETPINDTARACIALSGWRKIQTEIIQWIQKEQKNDNWNNSEIDTAYALMALGDRGIKNENGCQWLFHNYGKKWEHPGTTSLIITAFSKQDKTRYGDFIKDRANWLILKRENGGWTYIATSNLVIQALILSGIEEQEIAPSIAWLLGKQDDNGSWKDIISTTLTLISLKMYLDKFNSGSDK
jgi:hypothetical protein